MTTPNLTAKPPSLKAQGYLPKRYVVAFMSFLGFVVNYMLRVNINLTIVAMVKTSNSSNSSDSVQEVCGFDDETSSGDDFEEGEFEWNEWTQGLITGSFFWGYLWTQIPGGRLAEVVGARKVMGVAMTFASLFTLVVPVAANAGYLPLIIVRVLLGLAEGATFPCNHALLSSWAPPHERSILAATIYAGSQAGTIVAYPMAAAIIKAMRWEAVFYIQGCIGLVWCAAWFFIVADSPSTHKTISKVELEYIVSAIGDAKDKKPPPVPVKAALTSLPFWAILVANVGNNWGFFTLLTDLPMYMNNMLMQDISSNALLSGLPYLGMWIFSVVVSVSGDKMLQANILTTQTFRKIANSIGKSHLGPAVALLILTFVECNREATIAFLFIAVSLQGALYSGFSVNHVDISPNFAGTLYGITNAFGTFPGWLAPLTVGALTNGKQTFQQWRKVFYIAAAIFTVDAVFFIIFASGEVQDWNYVYDDRQNKQHQQDTESGQEKKEVGKENERDTTKKKDTEGETTKGKKGEVNDIEGETNSKRSGSVVSTSTNQSYTNPAFTSD
ncbi:hypothetical protein Pcinc_017627 [Petrolisthes cinctipes]|uniref:Sialin n=1 Tax=Petrolisthes cinctipes TaxID=88211 RepID=A0AAE1FNW0_PETCI|nr:hypothetical protein Pcinc_017627 [Petrolisthes cinctipes]